MKSTNNDSKHEYEIASKATRKLLTQTPNIIRKPRQKHELCYCFSLFQ